MKWHEKPERKVNQARQAPRVVFSPGCYFSVQSGVEIKTKDVDDNQSKGRAWREVHRWRRGENEDRVER